MTRSSAQHWMRVGLSSSTNSCQCRWSAVPAFSCSSWATLMAHSGSSIPECISICMADAIQHVLPMFGSPLGDDPAPTSSESSPRSRLSDSCAIVSLRCFTIQEFTILYQIRDEAQRACSPDVCRYFSLRSLKVSLVIWMACLTCKIALVSKWISGQHCNRRHRRALAMWG